LRDQCTAEFCGETPEVPLLPCNILNFGARDEIDIEMPADLDQFREMIHGAVIGGKVLSSDMTPPMARTSPRMNVKSGVG
jgi:hypothetical protein